MWWERKRAREREREIMKSFVWLCIFFCWLLNRACQADQHAPLQVDDYAYTIQVDSLFSKPVCTHSTKGLKRESSLEVVHRHGPCTNLPGDAPTVSDVLRRDEARVNWINSKLSINSQPDSANLPAKDGSSVGSGNYIVSVGFGTPAKYLSLIFDTGSDLTWTQCKPCIRSCYNQKDPIFDPSLSSSYSNISCSSDLCSSLASGTGNSPGCSSSTCIYGIQYGDSSFSVGFFGKEKLTLTPRDVFNGFLFGCGQNNQGLFGGSAGLIGLGRDPLSLPSQTAAKYNKIFSYCLPSSSSSTGHLTFGAGSTLSRSLKFTPISTFSRSSFYGLDFTAISVGGQKLSIPTSVFSSGGTIIDSGTVITRLPSTAYAALRNAFRQRMKAYPTAPALSILDTCYDFSGYKTITVPKISFFFSGGVEVEIGSVGILYGSGLSQVCLAFAGNSDDGSVGIFGNVQQQTLEVVYDVGKGRIGFAPGGCS
ncbi:aspartyl protease family protein At5g10770-like [Carica papaya]|uniref:aspartyl protease family protein At5g10770-like n=1 Tax=Carica papaya TaxID=3649 RepID=UPI000B8CFC1E|nr:aspartyl protease family protein At5g10770-like [Carica papaya]